MLQFGQYILSVNHCIIGTDFFVLFSFSEVLLDFFLVEISIVAQKFASTCFVLIDSFSMFSEVVLYTQNFFVSDRIFMISSFSLHNFCSSNVIRSNIQ
jgi:hypothetical protein